MNSYDVLGRTTGEPEPLLVVDDLQVAFGSEHGVVDAVRGVSFELRSGTTLAIAGESGSGKSVTSLALMGLLPDAASVSGSVRLRGRELIGLPDKELSGIRGRDLAMVFQDPMSSLTPVFSVGQQIVESLDAHQDLTRAQARRRAAELLDLVGIPNPAQRLAAFPHEFSGGMRQRVMIAMAIANDPDVIIADEPTTALDVTVQAQVLEVLKTAQRETGAAVLMITHDLGVVAGMADEVLVMYGGKAVERGPVDEIYERSQMPYTMGLLAAVPRPDRSRSGPLVPITGNPPAMLSLPAGCPFVPRCPLAQDECSQSEPELVRHGGTTGHLSACHRTPEIADRALTSADVYPEPDVATPDTTLVPREERATVLSVRDLRKHYALTKGLIRRKTGVVRAVDGITFDIRSGETLALVGESGCGKSTTLMELMALVSPHDGGTITVNGVDVATLRGSERRALRRSLQIVFQDPQASMDPRMPVYDVIAEPMRVQGCSRKEINARIGELMDLVGLNPDHVDRFAEQFSGGQRQRICIARALSVEPDLIVLDEPVASLDVSIQAGVINLLRDLQTRLGVSYLFVSHDMSVVRHIADRVAVMYLGRLVEVGDTEQVFGAPQHPYTRALLSAAPIPDPRIERERRRIILSGDLPSPTEDVVGCRFRSRCPTFAGLDPADQQRCMSEAPQLTSTGTDGQQSACHFPAIPTIRPFTHDCPTAGETR